MIVRMEQGAMGPKRWGRSKKQEWGCNAYARMFIQGPAYRIDSGQYRERERGGQGGMGVRRSQLPTPQNYYWSSSMGVKRIYKFRHGRDVLRVLAAEVDRICGMALPPGESWQERTDRDERKRIVANELEAERKQRRIELGMEESICLPNAPSPVAASLSILI